MGGWIAVVVLMLWLVGLSGAMLWFSIQKFRRWRKSTSVSTCQQVVMILLPSLLVAALFIPSFVSLADDLPVPMEELKEITAPVESIKQFTTTRTSRSGVTKINRYRIYLAGPPAISLSRMVSVSSRKNSWTGPGRNPSPFNTPSPAATMCPMPSAKRTAASFGVIFTPSIVCSGAWPMM